MFMMIKNIGVKLLEHEMRLIQAENLFKRMLAMSHQKCKRNGLIWKRTNDFIYPDIE